MTTPTPDRRRHLGEYSIHDLARLLLAAAAASQVGAVQVLSRNIYERVAPAKAKRPTSRKAVADARR